MSKEKWQEILLKHKQEVDKNLAEIFKPLEQGIKLPIERMKK